MEELHISTVRLLAMGISGLVIFLMPLGMWCIWRKKTRAAWIPLLAGLVGYLFAGTFHGMFRAVCLSGMQNTPWMYYILQAISAACFEEGMRYLIFRFAIPNRDNIRDAVSYGIGHGGLEHIIVNTGDYLFSGFMVGLLYKTQGLVPFAAEGLQPEETLELVRAVTETTVPECLAIVLDDAESLAVQCAFSVLVFTAVHFDTNLKWLGAAVLLHILTDILPAFHYAGDLSSMEVDVLRLLLTTGIIYLTYRVRAHDRHEANFT